MLVSTTTITKTAREQTQTDKKCHRLAFHCVSGFRGIRGRYLKSRGHSGDSSFLGVTMPTSANMLGTHAQMACAGHGLTISGPSRSKCMQPSLSQYVTALSARRMLSKFSTHEMK